MPPKATGTRWLPHLNLGLQSLFKSVHGHNAHLSTASHGNPKAEGLLRMMLNKELVAFMLFIKVIILFLSRSINWKYTSFLKNKIIIINNNSNNNDNNSSSSKDMY